MTEVSKVLIVPDLHVPSQDDSALAVLRDFKADWKPDQVVVLGDFIDADSVSDFAKGKRSIDQMHEYEIARGILDWLKPTVFLEGNHEERFRRPGLVGWELWRLLDPIIWFEIKERGIRWVPYSNRARDLFSIGKMYFIHGFSCSEHACKIEAESFGCVCHGHTHRVAQFTTRSATASNTGFNVGCLCKLDLDYQTKGRPRGWQQGFGMMYAFKSGHFSFYQVRLVGNEFAVMDHIYKRGKGRVKDEALQS